MHFDTADQLCLFCASGARGGSCAETENGEERAGGEVESEEAASRAALAARRLRRQRAQEHLHRDAIGHRHLVC